jgi:LEA14-like dessication related protein
MKEPKVEFSRVVARDANLNGATLVFVLKVDNPNATDLKVSSLDYSVDVGGKKLSDGKVEKGVVLAANSTGEVELPLPILYQHVFASLSDLLTKGTTDYKISGTARVGLFSVPFNKTGVVNLKQ